MRLSAFATILPDLEIIGKLNEEGEFYLVLKKGQNQGMENGISEKETV